MSVHTPFAWQGWRLSLPANWNPIRLDGDYNGGAAVFADLQRARLGFRWKKVPGRRFDVEAWGKRALTAEVGVLAAAEARPFAREGFEGGMLYVEPEPPGRDVWVGFSPSTRRAVELVYHSRRREHLLASVIVPTLSDLPADEPMPWSVFELSCIAPVGMRLEKPLLNAGDLSLTFIARKRSLTVRQVAVASLALKRMPLEKWLIEHDRRSAKFYRPRGTPLPTKLPAGDRTIAGMARIMRRRWRWWFRFTIPSTLLTYALHDEARDRMVILQTSDEQLARDVLPTVGWAQAEGRGPDEAEDE